MRSLALVASAAALRLSPMRELHEQLDQLKHDAPGAADTPLWKDASEYQRAVRLKGQFWAQLCEDEEFKKAHAFCTESEGEEADEDPFKQSPEKDFLGQPY